MTIHRTTIVIEVLHDGPNYDPSGPHQVAWDIDQGEHIGSFRVDGTEEIPADKVEAALIAIGNDGSFFGDEYVGLADAEPIDVPWDGKTARVNCKDFIDGDQDHPAHVYPHSTYGTAWCRGRLPYPVEPVEPPEPPLPTMASMVREARIEMIDLPEGLTQDQLRQCFNEVCEGVVPSMVTTLALMVAQDNRLAWYSADSGIVADDGGDVSGMAALQVGIAEEVKRRVADELTDELALEENRNRLAAANSAFEAAGGRGVGIAEEIDRLSRLVDLAEALG